jgi:hypothetical protein
MRKLALLLLLLCPCMAQAQYPLDEILEEGFVSHWMVCGPFPSGMATSLQAAVRTGVSPHSGEDFMAEAGGAPRVRPKHLQAIKVLRQPDAIWQRAGTESPSLDLAPFYPNASEGVSYAGFYADAAQDTQALMELHTPLGAQVWLNGLPVPPSQETALPLVGVDRTVLSFRKGSNFVLIRTPGIAYPALAEAAGVTERELSSQTFANRTLLEGKSGFEIAMTLAPVRPLGGLYVVPRLQSTGAFSGSLGDVRQEALLGFFNPDDTRSAGVQVLVKSDKLIEPLLVDVPGIPPGARVNATLPLPVGRSQPGDVVPVNLSVIHEGETLTLDASIAVSARSEGGEVLLMTGTRFTPREQESPEERLVRQAESLSAQLALADTVGAYGFEAGTAAEWQAWLALHPEATENWLTMMSIGRGGVAGNYARIDERAASPELLARNMLLGVEAARRIGGAGWYDAWDAPGIAPQTPQLVAQSELGGILSSMGLPGLPALGWHGGLAGEPVLHRHLAASEGATSTDTLRNDVLKRRRELHEAGFNTGLLVLENAVAPPEPFMQTAPAELLKNFPTIRISGSAAQSFFDSAGANPAAAPGKVPAVATSLMFGDQLSNPVLRAAYNEVARRAAPVESLATLAALKGYAYPADAFEWVWRALAWYGQADYLNAPSGTDTAWRALDALRRASEHLDAIESGAMATLAEQARFVVPALPDGVKPLATVLVFAAGGTDSPRIAAIDLPVPDNAEVVAFDANGASIPTITGESAAQTAISERAGILRRIEFAIDIPAWGLAEVHLALAPADRRPASTELLIESDQWLVQFDPSTGALAQALHKPTGKDHARGQMAEVMTLGIEGEKEAVPGRMSKVETHARPGVSWITVTRPLADGTWAQTVRVWDGVPYIEIAGSITGLRGARRQIVSTIGIDSEGRAPIFGERFGAIVGAPTSSLATAPYPAWQWAAESPTVELRFGLKNSLPLCAAAIAHGGDEALAAGARTLQSALHQLGIPSTIHQSPPPEEDELWSDATTIPDAIDALDAGAGMLILLGTPEANPLVKRVVDAQTASAQQAFVRGIERVGTFAMRWPAPSGQSVPVLVIAGRNPELVPPTIEAVAEGLIALGFHTLPDEAWLGDAPEPRAEDGMALLFPGAQSVAITHRGEILLHHGVDDGSAASDPFQFRYALHPFTGDWRTGGVQQTAAAYATSPTVREVTPAAGVTSLYEPLLEASPHGLHIVSLKQAAHAETVWEGVALRAYADMLAPWSGTLSLQGALAGAESTNLLENSGASLDIAGGSVSAEAGAGEIITLSLAPKGVATRVAKAQSEYPQPARYPLNGDAIAPEGGAPLGLHVVVDWAASTAQVFLVNASDQAIEGDVSLSATDGLSVGPEGFSFELSPGETRTEEITLSSLGSVSGAGAVLALAQTNAGDWYDCAHAGNAWLDVEAKQELGRVVVHITNRMGVRALGNVRIAASPHHWPGWHSPLGEAPPPAAHPREVSIDLPPLGKQEYTFLVASPGGGKLDAAALVSANGHNEVLPIAGR